MVDSGIPRGLCQVGQSRGNFGDTIEGLEVIHVSGVRRDAKTQYRTLWHTHQPHLLLQNDRGRRNAVLHILSRRRWRGRVLPILDGISSRHLAKGVGELGVGLMASSSSCSSIVLVLEPHAGISGWR